MEQFMKEEFDFKRFFLLNIKRIWLVILTAFITALVFAVVYYLNHVVFKSDNLYRCDGIYNIEFDMDLYGDTIQYYNDYTWNDVIDSDIIAGKVADKLGISSDLIYASTSVPTMSDIRIIHIYVDNSDKELAVSIQKELAAALSEFGLNTPGFLSIENWSMTEAYELKEDLLIGRVTVFGLIFGALLSVLFLFYKNAMDDSVYTQEDGKRYTAVNCAGICCENMSDEAILSLKAYLSFCYKNEITLVTAYKLNDGDLDYLKEQIFSDFDRITIINREHKDEFYNIIKDSRNVLLLLPYGKKDGNYIRAEFARMKEACLEINNFLIIGADRKFVKAYYGSKAV